MNDLTAKISSGSVEGSAPLSKVMIKKVETVGWTLMFAVYLTKI